MTPEITDDRYERPITGYIDVEFQDGIGEEENDPLRLALDAAGLKTRRAVDCTLTVIGSVQAWQRMFRAKVGLENPQDQGWAKPLQMPVELTSRGAKNAYFFSAPLPTSITGEPYEVQGATTLTSDESEPIVEVTDGPRATIPLHEAPSSLARSRQPQTA